MLDVDKNELDQMRVLVQQRTKSEIKSLKPPPPPPHEMTWQERHHMKREKKQETIQKNRDEK